MRITKKIPLVLICTFLFAINAECQNLMNFDTYNTNDNLIEESYSTVILDGEKVYNLKVVGSYSIWAPSYWSNPCGILEFSPITPSPVGYMTGDVGFDMEYIYSLPNTSRCNTATTLPYMTPRMEITLDNGQTWFHPFTSDPFNNSHEYNYSIVGQGYPLGVRHVSPLNSDDYGILNFSITTPTDINDVVIESDYFSIYPNPTSETIRIGNPKMAIQEVVLSNLQGGKINLGYTLEDDIAVDISKLSAGLYFISLKINDSWIHKKVMIK